MACNDTVWDCNDPSAINSARNNSDHNGLGWSSGKIDDAAADREFSRGGDPGLLRLRYPLSCRNDGDTYTGLDPYHGLDCHGISGVEFAGKFSLKEQG